MSITQRDVGRPANRDRALGKVAVMNPGSRRPR